MSNRGKKLQNLPGYGRPSPAPGPRKRQRTGFGHGLGVFGLFLLLLILAGGVFILVTNVVYLWQCQPGKLAFNEVSSALLAGIPATARTEADRQSFYSAQAAALEGLPDRFGTLNNQPWTLAVLFKDDLKPDQIQAAQDKISRGQKAVAAYFQASASLSRDTAAFLQQTGKPGEQARLSDQLTWYADRIDQVDAMENAYAALSRLPDLELAGSLLSRDELGLTEAAAKISSFRQPVQTLRALLDDSAQLETKLDILYGKDPLQAEWAGAESSWTELLAGQKKGVGQAASLASSLPEPLLASFQVWQTGLANRSVFIQNLQGWWQDAVQVETSLDSAAIDRATARRYIADSLKEANVETAYLWTRTAQEYILRMNTAIDFANIAIEKANRQIRLIGASRELYRTGLGSSPDVRQIPELEKIQPDVFWLTE